MTYCYPGPVADVGSNNEPANVTCTRLNEGVSVLFARADSCYFELRADVWDAARDARRFVGDGPVIVHPPCRGWGRLSHQSVATDEEKAMGIFAAEQVRRCGGVLEHPWASKLFKAAGLPKPSDGLDAWGGFTILIDQGWFGHAAPKPTWIYICGVDRRDVPGVPVTRTRAKGRTLELPVAQREATPPDLAKWLLLLAARCNTPKKGAVTCIDRSAVTRGQGRRNSYVDLTDQLIG